MTWSGTRRDRRKWHDVGDELASVCIEVPHVNLVGAEIDAKHVIAIQIGEDLVRMRPLLAVGVWAGSVADALEIVGHCANRAVTEDPKYLKVAAGVAGRK